MKPAIEVRNVSKAFKLPHEKHSSIKSVFVNIFKPKRNFEKQIVLEDISFQVEKGDFFGIVGRNGSGKSTLLKLMAGVYSPNSGAVVLNGKLTPFIELGVGFNPELTGRENVFLNGALLGFSDAAIGAMYDEIVEFAELERFMDQKLKNYSSGMQVRLAFSIAIKSKNDILIFDEVLAVGDEAFQRKCLDVFETYKAQKQTVVLVTHDMETVRKFCNRAMLINEGQIVKIGKPRDIASEYSRLNQNVIDSAASKKSKIPRSDKLRVSILNTESIPLRSFDFGGVVRLHIVWNGINAEEIESLGVSIFKLSGEYLTGINSRAGILNSQWKKEGSATIDFDLNIEPGKYYVLVELFDLKGLVIESISEGLQFTVKQPSEPMKWSGLIELSHQWHTTEISRKLK